MNLNDINEVWLALEAERARITTLFEKLEKAERILYGKEKKDNKT